MSFRETIAFILFIIFWALTVMYDPFNPEQPEPLKFQLIGLIMASIWIIYIFIRKIQDTHKLINEIDKKIIAPMPVEPEIKQLPPPKIVELPRVPSDIMVILCVFVFVIFMIGVIYGVVKMLLSAKMFMKKRSKMKEKSSHRSQKIRFKTSSGEKERPKKRKSKKNESHGVFLKG